MAFRLWVTLPTWLAIIWRKLLFVTPDADQPDAIPRGIIIFRLDELGDLVLTTPLFRELRRMYPGAHCTIVVQPQYKGILSTNRNLDEVLAISELRFRWLPLHARRLLSALWFYFTTLRHRHYDLAISPRWDVDESLATMLCVFTRAGKRVGYTSRVSPAKAKLNPGFDAAFDLILPPGPLQHEVDRNLAVVEALGGRIGSRRLEITVAENDRRFATELLKHRDPNRLLVALGIGGRAPGRRWPVERYAEVIAKLDRHLPIQPVIVCSSDEDAEASALSVKLSVPPYILSGVHLRLACAVLERCALFIGNDSGAAHLAAAMDCPTVIVSRQPVNGDPAHANSPVRFAPRSPQSRVVQPETGGPGCTASCRASQPHCILRVSPELVLQAALELLSQFVPTGHDVPIQPLELHYERENLPAAVLQGSRDPRAG